MPRARAGEAALVSAPAPQTLLKLVSQVNPETRKRWSALGKALVTLTLLVVTIRLVETDTLVDRFRQADPLPLAASALLLIAGGFAGAASWFCVLRSRVSPLAFRDVAASHWIGMFFNSFLPTNFGGDVVKGYRLARAQGQAGFVVVSLLIDRAVNLCALGVIGLVALLLQPGRREWLVALAVALGALLTAASLGANRLRTRIARWPRTPRRAHVAELLDPVLALAAAPRRLFPLLLAAGASQILKTWQTVFVIRALGLDIPALCAWSVVPLFGFVSALPISIGGLGVREAVAHHLAAPLGMDNTHLVAFSLAGHAMVVLVNMLGVIPFLFARRKRAA